MSRYYENSWYLFFTTIIIMVISSLIALYYYMRFSYAAFLLTHTSYTWLNHLKMIQMLQLLIIQFYFQLSSFY